MGYYIDLSRISLDSFKSRLKTADLLPSQQILKERIDEKFKKLKAQNIRNIYQLQQTLKTKEKVKSFAELRSISVDYLTILRREVNSYKPQARKIKDFPYLGAKIKNKLGNLSIKTTEDLYDRIAAKSKRNELKKLLNISNEDALLLVKLTDVSRLRYVNQTFATLLVNSKYDTVEKIKKADYRELYENLTTLNAENGYFKGKIGLKDMKFFINDTANVSLDIEY